MGGVTGGGGRGDGVVVGEGIGREGVDQPQAPIPTSRPRILYRNDKNYNARLDRYRVKTQIATMLVGGGWWLSVDVKVAI